MLTIMKKINSIWYGGKILKLAGIFAAVIPILLYIISILFQEITQICKLAEISAIIGIVIFLFLILLLIVELRQDKKINNFYEQRKNTKIQISDTDYECQNCGSQRVKEKDKFCPACGIKYT
jgi:hypothetical protein